MGTVYYFGRWGRRINGKMVRVEGDGWKEALEENKFVADDRRAGRKPRVMAEELTVAELCNRFLMAKSRKPQADAIAWHSFNEYKAATDLLVGRFGERLVDDLAADDFEALRAEFARRWELMRLSNVLTRVKTMFKYGMDNRLIFRVVRYGSDFTKSGKAVRRRQRAASREPWQLRVMLDGAVVDGESGPEPVPPDPAMRPIILPGLIAGFGNHDCATLPIVALVLDRGILDHPRPETGIARRCPLWAETAGRAATIPLLPLGLPKGIFHSNHTVGVSTRCCPGRVAL
jgi:hypothetical protein